MGFFQKAGRQVEQFKQAVQASTDEDAAYQCDDCDARFHADHDQCPECGAAQVTATGADD